MGLEYVARFAFGLSVYAYFIGLVTYLFAFSTNAQSYLLKSTAAKAYPNAAALIASIFPKTVRTHRAVPMHFTRPLSVGRPAVRS